MVQMVFFIRYRVQLRRTRPELIVSLEDTVASAAAAAGAVVESGRKILSASFEEDRIGFWLDMALFLEKAHKALEKTARELYGFSLIVGRDIPESSARKLCRSLSSGETGKATGIWCSREIREALDFFVVFDDPANGVSERYRELKEFRSFDRSMRNYNYREKIERTLAVGADKNTLLLGTELADLKDGIYRYAAGLLGEIPPLVVRFGAGGSALICLADAFDPGIKSVRQADES